MSKKIKRYYAVKYFTENLQGPAVGYKYIGPRGAITGPWHINKSKKPIIICNNGFHAALMNGIEEYYGDYVGDDSRCFIVELDGKISFNDDKIAAEKIRLVKEIKLTYNADEDFKKINKIATKYKCVCYSEIAELPSKKYKCRSIVNLTHLH